MSRNTILLKTGNLYKYRGFDWVRGKTTYCLLIYLGSSNSIECYNEEAYNDYAEHNFYDVTKGRHLYIHPAQLTTMIDNCEIQNA
jgi:hypothetical protein